MTSVAGSGNYPTPKTYNDMALYRVERAGWEFAANLDTGSPVDIAFFRRPDELVGGSAEAAERLDLLTSRGQFRAGFSTYTDKEAGLVIEYTGKNNTRYTRFQTALENWGGKLRARQRIRTTAN